MYWYLYLYINQIHNEAVNLYTYGPYGAFWCMGACGQDTWPFYSCQVQDLRSALVREAMAPGWSQLNIPWQCQKRNVPSKPPWAAAQACATLQLMACTFRGDFEFFAVPALPVGDPGRLIKWQLWSHFGGGVIKVATWCPSWWIAISHG